MLICAFTPICEDDVHWIPQYLSEVERLNVPFVVHFDRCSFDTQRRMRGSRLCLHATYQDDRSKEYDETMKQGAMDVALSRAEWAMHWDVDETWSRLPTEMPNALALDVRWVNLWGDDQHIRVDGMFSEESRKRTKFYRRPPRHGRWVFRSSVVYGPTLLRNGVSVDVTPEYLSDVHCIHHGYKTPELRRQHKARWDRVYGSHSDGRNPYGTWEFICDDSIVPVLEDYPGR